MKSDFETFLETFPPGKRETIRQVWGALPIDMRRELELTMSAFAGLVRKNPASVRDLFEMIVRTAGPAVAPLHRLAIVGPVNVGKSTLFNAMTPGNTLPAVVSAVPGTTKESQTQRNQVFALIDTPGADRARDEADGERDDALRSAQESDFLLIVFDATRSITKSDLALFAELQTLSKPFLVVLNKIDRVEAAERDRVLDVAAQSLGLATPRLIALSAERRMGLDRLFMEVAVLEPRLLGELGLLLPAYRRRLSWQVVRRTTITAALIALTPIPLMDIIPLTAVQVTMVLTIARIYGQPLNYKRGREIFTGLGAGVIARTLFGELSKLGGVPGWVLSASIAAGTTLSIGALVVEMFETGLSPSKGRASALASKMTKRLKQKLSGMGRKTPTKERLTQALDGLLDEELNLGEHDSNEPQVSSSPDDR